MRLSDPKWTDVGRLRQIRGRPGARIFYRILHQIRINFFHGNGTVVNLLSRPIFEASFLKSLYNYLYKNYEIIIQDPFCFPD